MSRKRQQLFLVICLLTFTILTSGCFQFKADIDIHEDGSVTLNRTMIGNEFMQDEVEKAKKDALKNSQNTKVENISEGNMKGFRANTTYTDIRSMAKDVNMFDAHRGINNGVQRKEGILFDTYSIDLVFDNKDNDKSFKDLPTEQQEMAKSMLSNIKFDFTLNLPYSSVSNNASKVTNEGKTLYWDLSSALLGDETASIKATFKILRKDRAIALAAIAVLILLLMLNFLTKSKKTDQNADEVVKAKNYAILCGMLLLLLAGGTYYLIEDKPNFTEQDIISDIKDKPTSPLKTNSSNKTNEKNTPKSDATPIKNNSPSAHALDYSITPTSETALGPVDLCMSFDQLHEQLGKEEKPSKLDNDGFTHYYYPDLEILVANGRVESIYSNSSKVQTKRGVRQGDSVQDVLQKYGEPYGKTAYNGSTLYEYQFRSSNNDNCLLRFAVKNGVVDYIGSRIIR